MAKRSAPKRLAVPSRSEAIPPLLRDDRKPAQPTYQSGLMPGFVRKPERALNRPARNKRKSTLLRYIAPRDRGSAYGRGADAWDVPATGGYFGGCTTGAAMAIALSKKLRSDGECICDSSALSSVVFAFAERLGSATAQERDALRGQVVGFFGEIARALAEHVRWFRDDLDAIEERDLVAAANEGLGFDEPAFLAYLQACDDAEGAL